MELRGRLACAKRVERIAVAAQADVLGYVQARDRLQRLVLEGQIEDRAADALEVVEFDLERLDVHERDLRHGGELPRVVHARAHADMERRGHPSGRPDVRVEVVRVVGRGGQPVVELRVEIGSIDGLGARQRPVVREVVGRTALRG